MTNQDEDMQRYAILSCQLGIMGLEYDGVTPQANFHPNDVIDKAQFATILSRILYGKTYDGNAACWYCDHVKALQDT